MKRFYFSIFILFLFLFFSNLTFSQFKYENGIWVKNNTSTALTNAQVLIRVNTLVPIGLGWMQTDGKDIVFTSSCGGSTYLPHFVEAYLNTDSTKIWVKIPAIGASDSTLIYMYYGNPSATNISTLNVFDGPNSATDSVVVTSSNTVSLCQRGFEFTANQDVLVGWFGKRIPNATQRYVTLFDYTTQAILGQIQIDAGTVGLYNYNQLTTPIWLKAGHNYVLELFNGSGDMYYYGSSTQIGQAFTFINMLYCNSCTQNTFPTTTLAGLHYGTPDLLYYTYTPITPAPTCTILLAADTLTPAAPLNVHATPGSGQATIKWNKNTEFDMQAYNIFRNIVNNPSSATQIGTTLHPDTTYLATGLTNMVKYFFWVKAVDRYCSQKTSAFSMADSCVPGSVGISINNNEIPKSYKLYQNSPNPFNPTTEIKFDIPKASFVSLVIYDLLGREITTLVSQKKDAGQYQVIWNAKNYSSGVYIYKLTVGDYVDSKKLTLIK